jgi:hypothetical protein
LGANSAAQRRSTFLITQGCVPLSQDSVLSESDEPSIPPKRTLFHRFPRQPSVTTVCSGLRPRPQPFGDILDDAEITAELQGDIALLRGSAPLVLRSDANKERGARCGGFVDEGFNDVW